jgi:hypothetical protein
MDQEIRNKLRNVVTQCRKLLENDTRDSLEGRFRIYEKKGEVIADPNAPMTHLEDATEIQARAEILDHFGHVKARGFKPKEALDQLVREIAFTHLNRLCAYKMMEAREVYVGGQKFREAVSRGVNSNGVKFYLADHPEDERLFNTGHQDIAYRHFLDWLGGLLSDEIGVLFSPNDSANRLYPRQKTLDAVLDLLNGGGIKPEETELREAWPKIWTQDETIGWVYQYFTPKELRDAARDPKKGGSQAPRNSYELAFRNQFFTPRYVVEFLTDNTLGRIWYEMRKGDTKLKDHCRYMIRRPMEFFLKEGEHPPKDAAVGGDDLSQDDLLKLPVHIPHRPKKDPRELRILDPASGSGHFLLYCFDLLLTIYEEAYADPDLGPALHEEMDCETLEGLRRQMPRLILAHNLHGIDIDLRASQMAALALWLRCQRAYQDIGLKKERPRITRSNFVCAEPMPGEEQMLKDFVAQLEPKLLGQVVEVVFDKMKLAGEAGSLLKIEEEIRDTVASAKKQWVRETTQATDRKGQPLLFTQAALDRIAGKPTEPTLFDLSDITDDQFFEQAETKVIETLRQYAEKAQNGQQLQRRLFADDAVRGFSFVDLCHKRYDVVLMNPPFGDTCERAEVVLEREVPIAKKNTYIASVVLGIHRLNKTGMLGAITDSSFVHQTRYEEFREFLLTKPGIGLRSLVALGWGVLDSFVETSCFVIATQPADKSLFVDLRNDGDMRERRLVEALHATAAGSAGSSASLYSPGLFSVLPKSVLAFWLPRQILQAYRVRSPLDPTFVDARCGLSSSDNFRFYKLRWEVPPRRMSRARRWSFLSNGGSPSPLLRLHGYVVDFENEGAIIRARVKELFGSETRTVINQQYYYRAGFTYGKRTESITFQFMPEGFVFSNEGQAVFPNGPDQTWRILAYLNSSMIAWLLNSIAGQHKESGYVGSIPSPPVAFLENKQVLSSTESNYQLLATLSQAIPESQFFVWPLVGVDTRIASPIKALQTHLVSENGEFAERFIDIDRILEKDMGFCANEATLWLHREWNLISILYDVDQSQLQRVIAHDLTSYIVGAILGRWDIRFATGEKSKPNIPDPFVPLPVCVPGMLKGDDGLPLVESPADYPLAIDGDSILVDDADHADDIVRRVRDVFEVIWQSHADNAERDACESLGVREIRDYFRKPGKGGFWDDHITRYSKSRRKAPIYWFLQSSKKNYGIWLYYHRLDKDLLFKALVNYVEPKIRLETNRLETVRSQKAAAGDSGKEAKRLAKEVEGQEDFISELRDFEDKLRRAANLHLEPDLNDGVLLNIAPLHELVPWKEPKEYWDELLEGKYEWSSIGKQLRQKGVVK